MITLSIKDDGVGLENLKHTSSKPSLGMKLIRTISTIKVEYGNKKKMVQNLFSLKSIYLSAFWQIRTADPRCQRGALTN